MDKREFKKQTYEDEHGYLRWKDSRRLVHRKIAFKKIYLVNRKKYPLSFSEYQIDHKDGHKKNNNVDNLDLVPIREHELKHKILRHEYSFINTYFIFAFIFLSWFGYLGFVSGYKYNLVDILFMSSTVIIGAILIYLVNKKRKGWKYR